MKKHKAIFLDRDGTINVYKQYVWKIEDFEWIPEAKEGLKKLSETDYKIIVISNQAGIGRGLYIKEDVERLHEWMRVECVKEGIRIDAIYYCPHHPNDGCLCRKPNPGMIHRAAEEHDIDLKRSWFVGDNPIDIEAGQRAGVKTIKIKNEKLEKKEGADIRPHRHAEDLKEGVEYILRGSLRAPMLKIATLFIIIGVSVLLWKMGIITRDGVFAFLEEHPRSAPILFIGITTILIALVLPVAIIMGLGAGFLWGTWLGGIYTLLALALGSALGFWVSRFMAREAMRRYMRLRIWRWAEEETAERPWSAIFMLRLSQLVPLGIGTYLFGVTRMPFWHFFWGTFAVLLPSSFLFTALGDSIGGFVLDGNAKEL